MKQLGFARSLHQAGFFVIPVKLDGSKSPNGISWSFYKDRPQTPEEITEWFSKDCGVGVVGGPCSGNLEMIDFESIDVYRQWAELVGAEAPGLVARLVLSKTPGSKFTDAVGQPVPGVHAYYRVEGNAVPGNLVLAKNDAGELLIETRGNGGYVVLPGEPRVHASRRPYTWMDSEVELANIATITWEERNLLISSAESLNKYVENPIEYKPESPGTGNYGDRPGDLFNAHGDWKFLEEERWQFVSKREDYWTVRRPGKTTKGISATIGYCKGKQGNELLYVFSSNAHPFKAHHAYDRFAALTYLRFNGDFPAAAAALREGGFTRIHYPKSNEFTPQEIETTKNIVSSVNDLKQVDNSKTTSLALHELKYEGFQEPIPLRNDQPPVFPVAKLPNFLGEYCAAVAESSQTPVDLAAELCLGCLSGAFAGRIRVVRSRDYSEPLNLWTFTALSSGSRKSAVFSEIFRAVHDLEQELVREAVGPRALAQQQKRLLMKKKEKLEKEAMKTKDASKYDQLIQQTMDLAKTIEDMVIPPLPRLIADDVTTEKLGSMLHDQNGRMMVSSAEPSFLDNCKGRYSDKPNFEIYLKAYSGETIQVDRQNRGSFIIPSPRLTLACAGQPSLLASLKKSSEFRDRGYLGRFLYAVPECPIGNREIDTVEIPADLKYQYYQLNLEVWRGKQQFVGGRLHESPLHLSPEANEVWKHYASLWECRLAFDGDMFHLREWGSKLAGTILRVAAVLHLANATHCRLDANLPITAASMQAACELGDIYWVPHAKAAYQLIFGDNNLDAAEHALKLLRTHPGKHGVIVDGLFILTQRDFQRLLGCHKVDDTFPVIKLLLEHNYLCHHKDAPRTVGRPSIRYVVNPYVLRNPDKTDNIPG